MLFSRDKDDDDDFIPNPNYHSNLASIFGSSGGAGGNNSSLTYTPPKQPRRQIKPSTIAPPLSSTSRTSSLLCAKTVQTFKMVDGVYKNLGKIGAAIISCSTDEGTSYQILLYRDKQNHLSSARIIREFNLIIQPKNYCTFYDKHNVIWSLLFENSADMVDFNLEVAKCRWKAEQSTIPILIQDLWCPLISGDAETTLSATGDTVELTYTLSTIDKTTEVGQSERVAVEAEASGWKQALVGIQVNMQRIVILQPFMLGDLNPREEVYNSPVMVKFTVLQVTKAAQTQAPANPPPEFINNQVKEAPKPEPTLPEISETKTSEIPQSPKSTKADLINRMARMGQALPFKKVVAIPSDSDEPEEDHKSPLHRLNKVVPKPRTRVQQGALAPVPIEGAGVGEFPTLTPAVAANPQVPVQWASGIQPYMVGNLYPVPQTNSPLDPHSQFNMFLSEVRTTNSELRMGITRLTDKVENLQTKVEDSKKVEPPQDINCVLERLIEGEQQLKDQLQQVLTTLQTVQLASQSRASVEAATAQLQAPPTPAVPAPRSAPDPPCVEPCRQCAESHQVQISLSEKIKKLEDENEFLQIRLTAQEDALCNSKIADMDQLSRINTLQRQLSEEERSVSELKNSLESLQREKEIMADDLQTAKDSIVELQNTLREKQTNIDRLEQALKESEETKLEEVRRNLQEVLDPKPFITEEIKKILNTVYRIFKVQFQPQSQYDASFIQSVLAETIKGVTWEYLQNGDLMGLGRATPAVSVPSKPDVSAQENPEKCRSLYIGKDQRIASDVESKSSVTATSSEASLISQSNSTLESKEKDHREEISNSFKEQDNTGCSNTAVQAPTLVAETTDDSSDDGNSQVSVKLETILLHLAKSQTRMSDPLSRPWNPLPPPSTSWRPHGE